MTRTTLGALALLLSAAPALHSQIIQPGIRNRPAAWTSLSAGWFQQGSICGAKASTCWNFGGAPQFRASFEIPVGTGAAFGLAGTTARAPLIYASSLGNCSQCDADANVSQVLGIVRIGGGSTGFHQVIEIAAGTTIYTNFRSTDGTRLGDGKAVSDLTFGLGYGFGFSLSPRTQVVLMVQEWALVLHDRQPGSSENTTTQQNIRIGGRFALGER